MAGDRAGSAANTISVDVPVNGGFGIGLPVGKTLYNVTAFSFGRNNATRHLRGRRRDAAVRLHARQQHLGDRLLAR